MKLNLCQTKRCAAARRGSMLIQVMMYATLGSMLMLMGGACLHSALRADSSDRREALLLSSLHRAEQALRRDGEGTAFVVVSESELRVETPDLESVQWLADRGILRRVATQDGTVTARDQFIFPAGCVLSIHTVSDRAVAVRVTEPALFVKYPEAGNGGDDRNKPPERSRPLANVRAPHFVDILLKGGLR